MNLIHVDFIDLPGLACSSDNVAVHMLLGSTSFSESIVISSNRGTPV